MSRHAAKSGNSTERQSGQAVFIYDAECTFCIAMVEMLERLGVRAELLPSSSAMQRFPRLPPDQLNEAAHWVAPDGTFIGGAAAIAHVLSSAGYQLPLRLYTSSRVLARAAESLYSLVASNRGAISRLGGGRCGRCSREGCGL